MTPTREVSSRELWVITVVICILAGAIPSLVAWIHAQLVVPQILDRANAQIHHAISQHVSQPHPAPVLRAEHDQMISALERIERRLEEQEGDDE